MRLDVGIAVVAVIGEPALPLPLVLSINRPAVNGAALGWGIGSGGGFRHITLRLRFQRRLFRSGFLLGGIGGVALVARLRHGVDTLFQAVFLGTGSGKRLGVGYGNAGDGCTRRASRTGFAGNGGFAFFDASVSIRSGDARMQGECACREEKNERFHHQPSIRILFDTCTV